MGLDLVHDIQKAYRQVLDSMSQPGKINTIHEQAMKNSLEIGCFPSTIVLIQMLFDTEIKFKVCSKHEKEWVKLINQLTYAQVSNADEADFILILNDAERKEAEMALKMANVGDLQNPQYGATFIVEARSLNSGQELKITGPGIMTERLIKVDTLENLMDLRAEKNAEYPLGIDLIFIDSQDHVLCLPRTTQIEQVVR